MQQIAFNVNKLTVLTGEDLAAVAVDVEWDNQQWSPSSSIMWNTNVVFLPLLMQCRMKVLKEGDHLFYRLPVTYTLGEKTSSPCLAGQAQARKQLC